MTVGTIEARLDEKNWIRCGNCSHKLGRVIGAGHCVPSPIIEIKCHSCKSINVWWYVNGTYKAI